MQTDRFKKARLTIQECSFPNSLSLQNKVNNNPISKRISFAYLSSSFDKKHRQSNPQTYKLQGKVCRIMRPERINQPIQYVRNSFESNIMNLPQIKTKHKIQQSNSSLEPFRSYSSTKLLVTPYHKIENLISTKYSSKIQTLKKASSVQKLITISQMNGNQLTQVINNRQIQSKVKQSTKSKIIKSTSKSNINRLKGSLQIPEQLTSYKCEKKMYDNDTFNLKLKNILRFQFDASNRHANKVEQLGRSDDPIEGWRVKNDNMRTPALYLY